MMKLPDIRDFDLKGKRVLLRTDLDVPLRLAGARSGQAFQVEDETRIEETAPTVQHLLAKSAKVVILTHLGRPSRTFVSEFSLEKIAGRLGQILGKKVTLIKDFGEIRQDLVMFENLRFWAGEEKNETAFAKDLASLGDFYVNDAFAASHRKHASIVSLPKLLPCAAGLDLLEEVEVLSQVREKPKRPVVVILGGVKKDKLETVPGLMDWADLVLIGGKLVTYPEAKKWADEKKELALLSRSGEDISLSSALEFVEKIKNAGTIVWSGPLGEVEEKRFERGTRIFAEAMVASDAFRIVGGGETVAALTRFGLEEEVDFVSSGGGAMLAFFAQGDLPGLKALREGQKDKL